MAELKGTSKRRIRNFTISGPRHLGKPDWSNPTDMRSILASLVQGVSVLQKSPGLAPPWWTFFNFHPTEFLEDKSDGSIFAAVFENHHAAQIGAPEAVVAFRGTIIKCETVFKDVKVNWQLYINGLHRTSRFKKALEVVRSTIARHGHKNVWITGHSMGAALAMAIGREICEKEGFELECHLFNPPFPSSRWERIIEDENLKRCVQVFRDVVIAGLVVMLKKGRREEDAFDALYNWIPTLYVNPCDVICSGYVAYFGNRERMPQLGEINFLAARHCSTEVIPWVFGKDSKPSHLIPSARLVVNQQTPSEFKEAHCLHQWWSPEHQVGCELFRMKRLRATCVMDVPLPAEVVLPGDEIEDPGQDEIPQNDEDKWQDLALHTTR